MDNDVSKIGDWLLSGRMGESSKALAAYAIGARPKGLPAHPMDTGDFGRCALLIQAAPFVREAVDGLAEHSAYWKALSHKWDAFTAAYEANALTYDDMRAVLSPIEKADPRFVRLGSGASIRF